MSRAYRRGRPLATARRAGSPTLRYAPRKLGATQDEGGDLAGRTYMSGISCDPAFAHAGHGPHDMRPLQVKARLMRGDRLIERRPPYPPCQGSISSDEREIAYRCVSRQRLMQTLVPHSRLPPDKGGVVFLSLSEGDGDAFGEGLFNNPRPARVLSPACVERPAVSCPWP